MSIVTAKVSMTRLPEKRVGMAIPLKCSFEDYPSNEAGKESETPQNFTREFTGAPHLARWTKGQFGRHSTLTEAANAGKRRCFCWTADTDVENRYKSKGFLEGTACPSLSLFVLVSNELGDDETFTRIVFKNRTSANQQFSNTSVFAIADRDCKLLSPFTQGKSAPDEPVLLVRGVCSLSATQAQTLIGELEFGYRTTPGARGVISQLTMEGDWAKTIRDWQEKGSEVHISVMSQD